MICVNCRTSRAKEEFYSNDRTCKYCRREKAQKNRARNIDKIREYDRSRGRTTKRIEKNKEYINYMRTNKPEKWRAMRYKATLKYRTKHKDRQKARTMINNLLRDKKLIKEPCIKCGSFKVQAHHKDYKNPLDIIWLCDKHHKAVHLKEREAQRTK